MPAVGILKKPSEAVVQRPRPPPPPPPQAAKNGKPVIPPKPKRGIPPPGHAATPVSDGEKLRDVRFADEEEPTTEDSYDYKDLDFASDIFEFRPPPPRPRPPHPKPLLYQPSNGDARPTEFSEKSTPLQTEDNVPSDLENEEDRMMSLEAEDLPQDDGTRPMDEDDDDDDDESDGKVDDLDIFLQEHEGKELTVEDVRQLERLLDAAEKAEAGVEEDDKDLKDMPVSDANEDRERMPAVRFGRAEFLDDGLLENAGEEEMEEGEVAEPVEAATEEPRSDYNSTVEFQRRCIGVKGRQTSVDSGTYEPVGPPDLRFVRPDLSGYVPPQPSPRIGDPFSWRRRGKRRHDRYGYETTPFGGTKGAPALSRILDGCQKLELFIASRHLGPPGMLLNTLGGDRRRKRKMKESPIRPPPRRPPPPVPPKISTSILPSLPNESTSSSPPGDDVVEESSAVDDDQEVRMALEADLEKQIWVEHAHNDVSVVETTIEVGTAPSDVSQMPTDSDSTTQNIEEIEPVITKAEAYQTGDCEKSTEEVKIKNTEVKDSDQKRTGAEEVGVQQSPEAKEVSVQQSPEAKEVSVQQSPEAKEVSVQQSPEAKEVSVQQSPGAEEVRIQQNSEEIDRPKRTSRKDVTSGSQRPWQVPCRPERRKRVASAEPPLTVFGLEREQEQEQELERAPPRRKPKRSASFHTAEEIRRKIDAQAQYFLRTPRRKERSSTEYLAAYPSASASLTYGTLRRKGRALTPVYSHVDKSALRRKEAAVQAPTRVNSVESEEGQEENQSSTPQIPDSPPKISEVECQIDEKPEDDEQVESKEDKLDIVPESVQADQTEIFKDLQQSSVQEEGEDSKVPSEFHNLKSSPEQDVDTSSSSPATRPLPPPPAPPRRKHAATTLSKELLAAGNSPVVFCGIFPKDDSSLSGKVTVIPRMKVMELSVVRLEASHLRVSHLDADHLTVARTTLENRQDTPLPPKPQGGGESGENGSRPVGKEKKGSSLEDQQELPQKDCGDSSNKEVSQGPPSDDGSTKTETTITGVPVANGPFFPDAGGDGEDGWQSFDPAEDRTGCESPLGTITSTTSGSASYVTCDETLHLDDVENDLGLTNGLELSDTDIGEDFVSELEDDDDGTGCPTPTEREAPSIPDAFLSSTAPSYLSSFLALSPSASLSSSDISFSSPDPISRNAAPAEMDENFNLWNPEFKNMVHHVSHSQGTDDDISRPVPNPDQDHEAASGEPVDIPKVGSPHDNSCQKPDESGRQDFAVENFSGEETSNGELSTEMNNTASGKNDDDSTFRRTRSARRSNAWRKNRSGNGVSAKTRSCFYTDGVPDSAETAAATPSFVVIQTTMSNGDFETDSESWSHSGSDSGNRSRPESESIPLSSEEEDDEDSDDDSLSRKSSTESMKRKKSYHVAREMMTSEKVFVDVLKLLNEDFPKFVKKEGKIETGSIPDDVFEQILDCLPTLQALNEDLLKCMVERIKKWDEIGQISDIMMKHGPFLKLYTTYIQKFPALTNALEEACKKYTRFGEAVKKFEMSERCRRLTIKHYMLKPVQRIPQYKLLLQEYQKYIDETSVEYENTRIALVVVSEVAEHANRAIKEAEKFEKLLEIQNRIYGGFEVVKPGRILLKEGELNKLCRKGMAARTFLMFNDSLLHCSMSQGLLRVHHELPLSTVKIEVPCQEAYQNEFSIISVTRSFTLSASSPEEKQEWLKALQDAIDSEAQRRKTFLQVKLNMQGAISEGGCDDYLGKKAPVWIPDSRVTMCQLCAREFTFAFRRHHCRACGKVVCSVCSSKRAPLRYLKYRAMRVCDKCFDTLQKEVEEGKIELDESSEPTFSGRACLSPSILQLKAQFQKFSGDESPEYLKAKPNVRQVLKEVGANDTESSAKGYLYFRAKKIWKKQWFVIKDKVLYCYKASEDVVALSSTPLLGFDVVVFSKPKSGIHQQLYFELRHAGHPDMAFYAESIDSATRWQLAMKEATILE